MNFRLKTLVVCTSLSSFNICANEPFQVVGASVTTGNISFQQDISSISNNPAASSHFARNESGFVMNILPPIGAGYEVGQIDSLLDELDELIDILENDDLSAQDALDAKERFDPFLEQAAIDGMVKVSGHAGIPIFPLFYFNNELGAFTLNAKVSGSLRSTVLDDDIDIIGFNDSFKINTSAALYVPNPHQLAVPLFGKHII